MLAMIKVIEGKRYNTEKATLVYSYWNGCSTSDFRHRSKTLYLTQSGVWFLHHEGGALTDMAVRVGNNGRGGSEDIEPVSADDAYGFLEAHSGDPEALKAIETYFADRHTTMKTFVAIQVDQENNAEQFWEELREYHENLADALGRDDCAIVKKEIWEAIKALPGFSDGPDYARDALLNMGEANERFLDIAIGSNAMVFER